MDTDTVLRESVAVKETLAGQERELAKIAQVTRALVTALEDGNTVVLFGNGGSAADAQHIAAELSGRFRQDRDPLPALSLTTNTSALTAIANDYAYETVFARQVAGLVTAGDVVVGISTSGTSANVVAGIDTANDRGATTVGLTGEGGGDLAEIADTCIQVPSTDTARIQEAHITIGHAICGQVEEALFG